MGCFNKIGFVSNLPITYGNETVLIFVEGTQFSDMSGVVYSDDICVPILLPIFGEYDDYGRIENVVRDKNVEFIESFFGTEIDSIIEMVDNCSVGRSDSDKYVVPKNNNIFKKLSFCLEHKAVYEKMASDEMPSYIESNIGEYWLDKLGWKKDGKTEDGRYKYKWIYPSIDDLYIQCDGNWSHLCFGSVKSPYNQLDTSIYHPYELVRFMEKLDIKNPLSKEDMEMSVFDLSYDITGEEIRNNIDIETFRHMPAIGRWPKGIFGIDSFLSSRQYKLSALICWISAGINKDVPDLDGEILRKEMKNNICDYMRFNSYLSRLNGKYFPSNYGSQDVSLEKHIEINKVYQEVLKNQYDKYGD